MQLKKHLLCRVCLGILVPVIDLGHQHIQGAFIKDGVKSPCLDKIPMRLSLCPFCNLLQLEYTVSPEDLYSHYWYRSGTNRTMREHLCSLAHESIEILGQKHGRVLDIGCNDGTLLKCYPDSFEKVGVDPSNILENADSSFRRIRQSFPSKDVRISLGSSKFDIITSVAMFYDVDDPVSFAREVKDILAPEGIWVIEVAYMPSMLWNNSYDTICAEHIEYYSLHALRWILMSAGLWAFRATESKINGGSVRVYARHSCNFNYREYDGTTYDLFDREMQSDIWMPKAYLDFQRRIEHHRDKLVNLLCRLKASGNRIHVYGASTKGNTVMQWCGIDHSIIDAASDRNPEKVGACTIGTNIPIISEEDSRAMNPDYYLVLPWCFREEFIEREHSTLSRGTKFIFPFPNIEIVGSSCNEYVTCE